MRARRVEGVEAHAHALHNAMDSGGQGQGTSRSMSLAGPRRISNDPSFLLVCMLLLELVQPARSQSHSAATTFWYITESPTMVRRCPRAASACIMAVMEKRGGVYCATKDSKLSSNVQVGACWSQ